MVAPALGALQPRRVGMDVPRRRRSRARHYLLACLMLAGLGGAGAFISTRLAPRPESVRRATIWSGRVEHSPFVVRVKGAGSLRPEVIRWLTTESSGRVEQILLVPGAPVEANTPVVRLENLELRLQAVQAEREVATGHAELIGLERSLREQSLERQAAVISLHTLGAEAARRASAYAASEGTYSLLDSRDAAERAIELTRRAGLAEEQLAVLSAGGQAQVAALRAQEKRLVEVSQVRDEHVERLLIRSGASGVLTDVLVELGQWVVPGSPVAKVMVSARLEAVLRIPADQSNGLAVGQGVSIDARSGVPSRVVSGHVRRVAPAANQGYVEVEVALDEVPRGARPEQSVYGSIEIERTEATLHLPRPVDVQPGIETSLFRIEQGRARRVRVHTGRASVDTLEIVSGLSAGDEIVLSDMSRYAGADELLLD